MTARNYKLEILTQYRLDYSKRFYVRELGKLLGTSHVTLLPHLQSLEEENVLVAKTIGKNKEYRLNDKNFLVKELLEVTEKFAIKNYFEKNKNQQKLYEQLCDLRIINPMIFSETNIYCIGEISNENLSKIKNIVGKIENKKINYINQTNNVVVISIDEFNKKILSHEVEIKKLLKNRIILQNSDFIVNLLWKNYVEFRRGEEV